MRKIPLILVVWCAVILGSFLSGCSHAPKKRGVTSDGTQEITVVQEATKLVLHNVANPSTHELSSTKETKIALATVTDSGIHCQATQILARSSNRSVVTQVHKDIFNFKKKEIIEERRTQTDAPFYTNRFKFTYVFQQKKSNPGLDRQEIVLICQTDFASVQPAMDLTVKEINDIFKKSGFELKNQPSEGDSKDITY